jgi:hypothetical protein
MRFRQVHLDFHTSGNIPEIGKSFDKKQFQQTLKNAHVDSITCFSSCHHGWSYHPTKVGRMHPNLDFDLLGAQIEACKEVDINVPVYLTAGVNNVAAEAHPEWREVGPDGRYLGWTKSVLEPGFKNLCFNSPYLEYLCDMISEVIDRYPNCDGIFLDIITQYKCCCKYCRKVMETNGLDPADEEDLAKCSDMALERYYRMTTETVSGKNPDLPLFHNSGHIHKNRKDRLRYFSHLEMESLPTGGWGYDHFPISAKYAMNLGMDYLGMTGKFHTTWGEFGGYKHPNALMHEVQTMLAFGAGCSVGDQPHPCAKLDESAYKLIGQAYEDVEKKEPWCVNADNIADIGVVCSEAVNKKGINAGRDVASDTGVSRLLLEGHYLFDLIDEDTDLSRYKMLVLPDEIELSECFKSKIDTFLDSGGKLLLTGSSGFDKAGNPMFDIGAQSFGLSEYSPDYILPDERVRCSYIDSPLVMYLPGRRIKVTKGKSLGVVYDPYFNRTAKHFCGHQHTPYKLQSSGYDCGVINGNIMYLAHPVFSIYRGYGAAAYKEYVLHCVDMLLGDDKSLKTNMPSTARVSLMHQPDKSRYILHLLYANKISRGGKMSLSGGNVQTAGRDVEIIEELVPLADVKIQLRLDECVKSVKLQPEDKTLEAEIDAKSVSCKLDSFISHAMIVMNY